MTPPLGTIEGFYGRPWSWEARRDHVDFLKANGFSFYIYAPKSDAFLRKRWREPWESSELAALAAHCRERGIEFGAGLSPFEAYRSFDAAAKNALLARLEYLDRIGVARLAILFDDMKGDVPGLAATQADMLHWVREHSRAAKLMMCPTYYSLDPVLDRIFGVRPPDYLGTLGRMLDKTIDVFWTGDQVCSKEYTVEGLEEIGRVLGRKPFLWDNYPVNDGPRMCKFLHLRPFSGRPPGLSGCLAGHAVNPMNQAELSKIPMLSLRGMDAGPSEFSRLIERDTALFQDKGLDGIPGGTKESLVKEYSAVDHPGAREVVDWLKGGYVVTGFE